MLKWTKRLYFSANTKRVFILPTINGIKLFILNFILLVMGLVYANNYLLLFNFVLFSIFIITMFYTHFNLLGLTPISIETLPSHANEEKLISINFHNLKNENRYAIVLNFYHQNEKVTFLPQNISTNINSVSYSRVFKNRGFETCKRISLETTFPLNLFRSFIFFDISTSIIIFPARINSKTIGDKVLSSGDEHFGEFNISEYRPGDKINSIVWKKIQENRVLVKREVTKNNNSYVFKIPEEEKLTSLDIEIELSKISSSLCDCYNNQYNFGLSFKGQNITDIACSSDHLKACLTALAIHEY